MTGGAGRIGRAIRREAMVAGFETVGVDLIHAEGTITADICDTDRLTRLFEGAHAVVHCAGLHAPHVGREPDDAFHSINVEGTRSVLRAIERAGVTHLVLSSSTAVLGGGSDDGEPARWIDDGAEPVARTIYHETKLEAEAMVRDATGSALRASIVRLGRCFPEEPRLVAFYRLCRGISERDAAVAHLAALDAVGEAREPLIACASTPFRPEDAAELGVDAEAVMRVRCPEIVDAFERRGWTVPRRTDRVYDSTGARTQWAWAPKDDGRMAINVFA